MVDSLEVFAFPTAGYVRDMHSNLRLRGWRCPYQSSPNICEVRGMKPTMNSLDQLYFIYLFEDFKDICLSVHSFQLYYLTVDFLRHLCRTNCCT